LQERQAPGEGSRFFSEEGAFDLPQAPWLLGYRCHYQVPKYSDDLFAYYGVPLPADLCSAVPSRRAEFLAGRHAALKALQRWGMGVEAVAIGRHRCPVWPVGWVGSITHDGDTAISAVARIESCAGLGIDLASCLPIESEEGLSRYIVQPEEARIMADWAIPRAWALTLAFSAKESLFKAVYPHVGRFFDFQAFELLSIDICRGRFWARTRTNLSPSLGAGVRVPGAFLLEAGSVCTLAWLPDSEAVRLSINHSV
jgi:enterobactin synthetase component D